MDLSIVIVNYNSKEKTINCIEAIKKSNLGNIDYEIIVVDNNSSDNATLELSAKYNDINIARSNVNLGMGGGNNLGIEQSRGEYVLVLNPDTLVRADAIKKMYNYIEKNEDVGIVGPKLLYPDGSLQYSCFRQWRFFTPIYRRTALGGIAKKHIDNFLMKDFDHKSKVEVDWLMGSCLFIRKSVLARVGLFDHRFFMYFEDTDLCRRVWKAGQKIVYLPEAVVVHDHGRASAEKKWYLAPFFSKLSRIHIASWLIYFMKWGLKVERFGK